MKLLLHTCCAPCSVQCIEALACEGAEPDLFWYNPNIHPYTEYRSRRDSLSEFAKNRNLKFMIEDEYGLRNFISDVYCAGKSAEGKNGSTGKRCALCYRLRLERTARFAAENAYDFFSTTLLISPYQNHELIHQTGEDLAGFYGLEFLYRDFRPRFRQGQNQARAAGYYMQKYCGCIFSEEERYLGNSPAPGNGKTADD